MDRVEFIDSYRKAVAVLDIPASMAVVGSGGACLMYGLRESTQDVDLDVDSSIFERVEDTGLYPRVKAAAPYDYYLRMSETISLQRNDAPMEVVCVNGVYCHSPEFVLWQKLRLNRPKDRADIYKLKRFIQGVDMSEGICVINDIPSAAQSKECPNNVVDLTERLEKRRTINARLARLQEQLKETENFYEKKKIMVLMMLLISRATKV